METIRMRNKKSKKDCEGAGWNKIRCKTKGGSWQVETLKKGSKYHSPFPRHTNWWPCLLHYFRPLMSIPFICYRFILSIIIINGTLITYHTTVTSIISDELKKLQRRALRIIYPDLSYTEPLIISSLYRLSSTHKWTN